MVRSEVKLTSINNATGASRSGRSFPEGGPIHGLFYQGWLPGRLDRRISKRILIVVIGIAKVTAPGADTGLLSHCR